jgi:hypothetical protein
MLSRVRVVLHDGIGNGENSKIPVEAVVSSSVSVWCYTMVLAVVSTVRFRSRR